MDKSPQQESKISATDAWAAIRQMQDTKGWKLFLARYAKKGDIYLTQLLDINLSDIGPKYTKRDLVAHQMEALGTVAEVISEFENEAKAEKERQD